MRHKPSRYVDEPTARALNLSYASEDHFIMRADHTTRLTSYHKGRKSVRVLSKKSYSHGTVMVADVDHMPVGCGTWPALWNVGESVYRLLNVAKDTNQSLCYRLALYVLHVYGY